MKGSYSPKDECLIIPTQQFVNAYKDARFCRFDCALLLNQIKSRFLFIFYINSIPVWGCKIPSVTFDQRYTLSYMTAVKSKTPLKDQKTD